MRFVKTRGHFPYVHPGNRIETVDPGSVVAMQDDLARVFVERGNGDFDPGPEALIRGGSDRVERPGLDQRPGRAERAVAAPQRAGAV